MQSPGNGSATQNQLHFLPGAQSELEHHFSSFRQSWNIDRPMQTGYHDAGLTLNRNIDLFFL